MLEEDCIGCIHLDTCEEYCDYWNCFIDDVEECGQEESFYQ